MHHFTPPVEDLPSKNGFVMSQSCADGSLPVLTDSPAPSAPRSAADVLEIAAALLSVPGAWCRGVAALHDGRGGHHACDDSAISWCALGATVRAADGDRELWIPAQALLKAHLGTSDVAAWNDDAGQTQANVVATIRGAAKASGQ